MKQFDSTDWGDHFQTPPNVCEYMASFLPQNAGTIFEPFTGKGNLSKALSKKGIVSSPVDLMPIDKHLTVKFDWIVMNPPFTPMILGYAILESMLVTEMSDNIIALMPWLTIINSQKRTDAIMRFGLKSITHLLRSVFKGSRVQCCILEFKKGFIGETIFRQFPEK